MPTHIHTVADLGFSRGEGFCSILSLSVPPLPLLSLLLFFSSSILLPSRLLEVGPLKSN